jgi:hypothetical protein
VVALLNGIVPHGTDVPILKIFSAKKLAKKIAVFGYITLLKSTKS